MISFRALYLVGPVSTFSTDNEYFVIMSNQANSGEIFNQLKHSGCYMNYPLDMKVK